MNIEVLLTEAEIADEFAEAMEARDLPEKFFYWSPASVRAWRELSANGNESLQQTWDALGLKAGDLTKSFGSRVPVISFGAGEGLKDRIMLKALQAAGREVKYYPVDASQTLLETACAGAENGVPASIPLSKLCISWFGFSPWTGFVGIAGVLVTGGMAGVTGVDEGKTGV